jgi:hypothetical protein
MSTQFLSAETLRFRGQSLLDPLAVVGGDHPGLVWLALLVESDRPDEIATVPDGVNRDEDLLGAEPHAEILPKKAWQQDLEFLAFGEALDNRCVLDHGLVLDWVL